MVGECDVGAKRAAVFIDSAYLGFATSGNGRHGIVDITVIDEKDAAKGLSAVLQRDCEAIPSQLVIIEVGLD